MQSTVLRLLHCGLGTLLAFALVIGLGACDSSTSPPSPPGPNFLDNGESWTYDTIITQRPVDSADVDTVNTAQVRLAVDTTGMEIAGRSGLIQVNAFESSAPERIDRSWYQQSPDSLVDVAYSFDGYSGFILSINVKSLKTANLGRGLTGVPLLVQRQLHNQGALDAKAPADTTVREDSRVVLQTPLVNGATWTAFDFRIGDGTRLRNRRTVLGDTTLGTPAGQYKVVEVKTTGSVGDTDFQYSDFYSESGLIKRVLADTLERTDADGTVLGEYVLREVHTLTDHEE